MPEAISRKRRGTLTGKKILEHHNCQVKVFLDNGIALNGILLDYYWDPVERDGVITLSSPQSGYDPSIVFRKFVTSIQPAHPSHANYTKKST